MKVRYFILLTLITAVISQLVHPNMSTWVPLSTMAYAVCLILIMGAIYFRHKHNEGALLVAVAGAIIVFTEYAIITAVAYFRMINTLISDGPAAIIIAIVALVVFSIIAFWDYVRYSLQNFKK